MPLPRQTIPHIFVSYKHGDEQNDDALDRIRKIFKSLKVQIVKHDKTGKISQPKSLPEDATATAWIDEDGLGTGDVFDPIIKVSAANADIGILLLTMDFFTSPYINEVELPLLKSMFPIRVRFLNKESYPIWLRRTDFLPKRTTSFREDFDSVQAIKSTGTQDDLDRFWDGIVQDNLQAAISEARNAIDAPPEKQCTVDIITSVKGGVGKTLLALMLVNHYRNVANKHLVALDFNTSNPDFYDFVANGKTIPEPLKVAGERWLKGTLCGDEESPVVRKTQPAKLFSGCEDMLRCTREMIDRFPARQFIVDTNMTVGNPSYSSECRQLMSSMETRRNKIRFWIIWTLKALLNPEYIRDDIEALESLTEPSPQIIHVINPTTLIPDAINPEHFRVRGRKLEAETFFYSEIAKANEDIERYRAELKRLNTSTADSVPDDLKEYILGQLKQSEEKKAQAETRNHTIGEDFRVRLGALEPYDLYTYQPLKEYMESTPSKYADFESVQRYLNPLMKDIQKTLKNGKYQNHETLHALLESLFFRWIRTHKTRPENILFIPYHDARLHDYTDLHDPADSLDGLSEFVGQSFESLMAEFVHELEGGES